MKMIYLFAAIIFFGAFTDALALSNVEVLESELSLGVKSFSKYIVETNPTPPKMMSEWYLKNTDLDQSRVAELKAFRAFGMLLLNAFDLYADDIRKPVHDPRTNFEQAENLLVIVDWLSKEPSYGNLLIVRRCVDLATIPIGRLVVNFQVSEKRIDTLRKRLVPLSFSPRTRMRVLKAESSGIFPDDGGQRKLELTWYAGRKKLIDWRLKHLNEKNAKIPESMFFFDDDPLTSFNKPLTTANLWDAKRHEVFVSGLETRNVALIEALAIFRKKVGIFPEKFEPKKNSPFTGIEGAFERAWRPYRGDDQYTRTLYAKASLAYTEIKNGQFVDEEASLHFR